MKFDLIGGTYEYKYPNINGEKTVNWEIAIASEIETSKTRKSLIPTPGLDLYASTSHIWGRGSIVCELPSGNRAFVVLNNSLYEVFTNQSIELKGTLTNITLGSSKVWMKLNSENQLFIAHVSASYIFDLSTNTLTQVTDVDFPGSVTSLAYSAGYFLVTSNGTIFFSNLLNGFNWTGTDFFNAEEEADPTNVVVNYKEDLFLFGSRTIQIYINDNSSPFSKLSRTMMHVGLVSNDSIAKCEEGIIFVGRNEFGQAAVYITGNFYKAVILSDFATTSKLNTVNDLEALNAFIQYSKNGDILYHLSVPSLHTTFVLNLTTKVWTEKQSKLPYTDSDGSYLYSCYRGCHPFNFNGMNLYLDRYSGNILKENYQTFTENGELIRRIRKSSKFDAERKYITVQELEIYSNSGSSTIPNAQLMLKCSKDAGYTFGNTISIPLNEQGNYDYRVRTTNLGTSRSWNFEFTLTDPVDVTIYDAILTGTTSAW